MISDWFLLTILHLYWSSVRNERNNLQPRSLNSTPWPIFTVFAVDLESAASKPCTLASSQHHPWPWLIWWAPDCQSIFCNYGFYCVVIVLLRQTRSTLRLLLLLILTGCNNSETNRRIPILDITFMLHSKLDIPLNVFYYLLPLFLISTHSQHNLLRRSVAVYRARSFSVATADGWTSIVGTSRHLPD